MSEGIIGRSDAARLSRSRLRLGSPKGRLVIIALPPCEPSPSRQGGHRLGESAAGRRLHASDENGCTPADIDLLLD